MVRALHLAGWSVGDIAGSDGAGGIAWTVSGFNGENRILASAGTCALAWRLATDQARSMGMLGRSGDPGE